MIALKSLLPLKFDPGVSLEPIAPFHAEFRGETWLVRAVLERTAVLETLRRPYERRLGRLDEVLVDPGALKWQPDTGGRWTEGGQPDLRAIGRLRGRAASLVTSGRSSGKQRSWNRQREVLSDRERAEVRAKSDHRALVDQQRNRTAARAVARAAARAARPRVGRKYPYRPRLSKAQYAELKAKGLKHCARCGETKPVNEFWANGYCVPCAKAYFKSLEDAGRTARSRQKRARGEAA